MSKDTHKRSKATTSIEFQNGQEDLIQNVHWFIQMCVLSNLIDFSFHASTYIYETHSNTTLGITLEQLILHNYQDFQYKI